MPRISMPDRLMIACTIASTVLIGGCAIVSDAADVNVSLLPRRSLIAQDAMNTDTASASAVHSLNNDAQSQNEQLKLHDDYDQYQYQSKRLLQVPTRPPLAASTPPNDACTAATPIPSLPYTNSATTAGATADFTTESCGADATANGVWYTYTATETKSITATVDSGLNLRIYEGTCDASNDDLVCLTENSSRNLSPTNDFVGKAGITYKFLVSKATFSLGSAFTIQVRDYAVPRNDVCESSGVIPIMPYQVEGSTEGALADFDENSCGASFLANGVWFTYTPSSTKIIEATMEEGQKLRIYSGSDCNDDLSCLVPYTISPTHTFVGEASVQYRFLISGQSYYLGESFRMVVKDYNVPSNDECVNGQVIPSLPFMAPGSTEGALPDFDAESCGAAAGANGVWYSYTNTVSADSSIVTATVTNQRLRVYSGGCDNLVCIGQEDTIHSFVAEPNVEYRFLVSLQDFSLGGDFTISVTEATPFPTPSALLPASPMPSDVPSLNPSSQVPSFNPTMSSVPSTSAMPSDEPSISTQPSISSSPSALPSSVPTISSSPSTLPSITVSSSPSTLPSSTPTSLAPTKATPMTRPPITTKPTATPVTLTPTPKPSPGPTPDPTLLPTPEPILPNATRRPTEKPVTDSPTPSPSKKPTPMPVDEVTSKPTTGQPTVAKETIEPTKAPVSAKPTRSPVTLAPTTYSDDCYSSKSAKSKAAKLFKSDKGLSMNMNSTSKSAKCTTTSSKSEKVHVPQGKAAKVSAKSGKGVKGKTGKDSQDGYNRLSALDRLGLIESGASGMMVQSSCFAAGLIIVSCITTLMGFAMWI